MTAARSQSESARFYEKQRSQMSRVPAITEKKMFGTTALCVRGKVFMFPWKERLVLKLPAERVDDLLASGNAKLFDPGHGRTSKTWVALSAESHGKWARLAREARAFVEE
jgi:TfoX/Sxy family transcriptional regulator of competence genes